MSGAKIAWSIVGIFIVLSVIGSVVGFANNWGRTAVEIVSPANVKAQHEEIIGKYNAMLAAADNVCAIGKGAKANSNGPTLVENPTAAYEATFRNIVTDYNNAMENIFKAKIVAPAGYPISVQLTDLDTTDWCTVSPQIKALAKR